VTHVKLVDARRVNARHGGLLDVQLSWYDSPFCSKIITQDTNQIRARHTLKGNFDVFTANRHHDLSARNVLRTRLRELPERRNRSSNKLLARGAPTHRAHRAIRAAAQASATGAMAVE
jgi:hypothetical protein